MDADGRFLVLQPDYSLRLARNCRAESEYSFWIFIVIALLCGFAGANFASSRAISVSSSQKPNKGAHLGLMRIRKLRCKCDAAGCTAGHF